MGRKDMRLDLALRCASPFIKDDVYKERVRVSSTI